VGELAFIEEAGAILLYTQTAVVHLVNMQFSGLNEIQSQLTNLSKMLNLTRSLTLTLTLTLTLICTGALWPV